MPTARFVLAETPCPRIDLLFADEFRRGGSYANWRSGGTKDWLLILTVRGAGRVSVASDDGVLLVPDMAVLYPPGTPQRYFTDPAAKSWHLLWSHFHPRPHWSSLLNWPEHKLGLRLLRLDDPTVRKQTRRALHEAIHFRRQRLAGSAELAMNALERALLWMNAANQHGALDRRVRRALGLMTARLHRPFAVEELARQCGLSGSRLAHLFRRQVGMAPAKYAEEIRLQRAAQLLRSSGLSVAEIAAETGYTNAFYFSNCFKKKFARSPRAYRERTDGS